MPGETLIPMLKLQDYSLRDAHRTRQWGTGEEWIGERIGIEEGKENEVRETASDIPLFFFFLEGEAPRKERRCF